MKKQPKQTNQNKRPNPKQRAFIEAYTSGDTFSNGLQSVKAAGYKGNDNTLRNTASRMLTKGYINAAINDILTKTQKNTQISRELQITRLNEAVDIAKTQNNVAGLVAAVREQNEMLGYHRELAPNAEKEAKRREHIDLQQQKIREKMAKELTDEAASEPNTIKLRAG